MVFVLADEDSFMFLQAKLNVLMEACLCHSHFVHLVSVRRFKVYIKFLKKMSTVNDNVVYWSIYTNYLTIRVILTKSKNWRFSRKPIFRI